MTARLEKTFALAKAHPWYEEKLRQTKSFAAAPLLTRDDLYAMVQPAAVQSSANEALYWSPSSGTSSKTLFFFPSLKSENDLQRRLLAPHFLERGLFRSDDAFFNLFPTGGLGRGSEIFESFAGYCGVTSFPLGHHLPPDQVVSVVDIFSPNVIGGMPNVLLDLAAYNLTAPKRVHFERILFGGEALTPGKLARLREAFSARGIHGIYGSAEAGILGVTMDGSGSPHYFVPSSICHLEIHDADQDGVGEIVVTNLIREAFPLLRYATGDRGRIRDQDEHGYALEFVGRAKASFQLAGEVVLVGDILEGLVAGSEVEDLQFILTHLENKDRLEIRICTGMTDDSFAQMSQDLNVRLNALRGVPMTVRRVERQELIRRGYSRKPPLIVDQRD